MAFSDLGSLGSTGSSGNNQSTLALTTAANAAAGELVVVCVAVDNQATGGGDDASTSGVTIALSGGTSPFSLTKGLQNATNLAAQAGISTSLWWGVIPIAYPTSSTITASFTTNSTSDATAITARHFSFASLINSVAVEATGAATGTTTNPTSLNATTANIACLRIRVTGCEYDSTQTITTTSTWTTWAEGASAATGTTTEAVIECEHLISTATGAASAPTLGSACDSASVYVAFKELTNPKRLPILDVPKGPLRGSVERLSWVPGVSPAITTTVQQFAPGWSEWFNPWGPKPLVHQWQKHNVLLTPPATGESISVTEANLTLTGSDITLFEGDIANVPAGLVGGYVPWGALRSRQFWTYRPLTLYQTVLESITIDAGALAPSGSSILELDTIGITPSDLPLSGSAVGAADALSITSGSLALVGETLTLVDAEATTVTSTSLSLSPQTIGVVELEAIVSGSLSLSGSDIDTSGILNSPGTYEWFNPWGPRRGRQFWTYYANIQFFPVGNVTVDSANISLLGQDIALIDSADVFMPAGQTAAFNPWGRKYPVSLRTWVPTALPPIKYVHREPLFTRIWRTRRDTAISSQQWVNYYRFIPTSDTIPIVSTNLVPIASTIGIIDTQAIGSASLTLAGSAIGESDSIGVTSGSLTFTQSDIGVSDVTLDLVAITSVSLALSPQSIGAVDGEAISAESLALVGQDIVSADTGTTAITSTSLALEPQDIVPTDVETIASVSLSLTPRDVLEIDSTAIVSGSLALVGQTIGAVDGAVDAVSIDAGALVFSGSAISERDVASFIPAGLSFLRSDILIVESDQRITSTALVLVPQDVIVTEVPGSRDPGPGRWYSQIGSWRPKDRAGPRYKIYP